MKLYDLTQELFHAPVYPGDPKPEKEPVLEIEKGDICNLTLLKMGSHTGTHLDAPHHFYEKGEAVSEIPLEKCIGPCKVAGQNSGELSDEWILSENDVKDMLKDGTTKLLLKGTVVVSEEAAREMVNHSLELVGVEGQTIGSKEAPEKVHYILLQQKVVILEGLKLSDVKAGKYILLAAPLKMEGLDGSPVRAVLMEQ